MIVSVVVCTHNGEDRIINCLDSLAKLELMEGIEQIEVLIVDNSSTDNTRVKILRFISDWSSEKIIFKYIFEPKLGLSNARNRGIKESRGDIIAFIDDDAVASPKWILELVRAHNELKADIVGGKTLSRPISVPPNTDPRIIKAIGEFDLGSSAKILKGRRRSVHGCNFSCRREVFNSLGSFDDRFGRFGEKKLAQEEYHLCLRARKKGLIIGYSPSAVVYHEQEQNRFTKDSVLEQAYWHGYSRCFVEHDFLGDLWTILSSAKKLLINFIRYCIYFIFSNSSAKVYWMIHIKSDIGFLAAACEIFLKRSRLKRDMGI